MVTRGGKCGQVFVFCGPLQSIFKLPDQHTEDIGLFYSTREFGEHSCHYVFVPETYQEVCELSNRYFVWRIPSK
ncbi:hypothetical protein XENTR_v10018692 [Xenopus tropicalis]|nr:hypothetical protein XENTR_v10018692 [Xenopus tropicalis]